MQQDTKNMSEYRHALADKILHAAMSAFTTRGIRAVKMDDLAASLSISKRTLYEIYGNKEDLLVEGVKRYYEAIQDNLSRHAAQCSNVMEILIYSFQLKAEEIKHTNPAFYAEVEKYPELLSYFEKNHNAHQAQLLKFLERGVDEGYFLRDLNYDFVCHIFDEQSRFVMEQQLYRRYSMETVFFNLIFMSLRGICTSKGLAQLDQFYGDYAKSRKQVL